MSLLSKLFANKKNVTRTISGLGEFTYYKDNVDEYWVIKKAVGELPDNFNFGAVDGNIGGPSSEAVEQFIFLSNNTEEIFDRVNSLFFEKASAKFGLLDLDGVKTKFYIKSLTCTSKDEFEFGLHSTEGDVFIELFYRNGAVTEVHIDEGCCESL